MAPPPFLPPPHGPWGRGEGGEKSFLGAERGAEGAPLRPQSPQGNELRKS